MNLRRHLQHQPKVLKGEARGIPGRRSLRRPKVEPLGLQRKFIADMKIGGLAIHRTHFRAQQASALGIVHVSQQLRRKHSDPQNCLPAAEEPVLPEVCQIHRVSRAETSKARNLGSRGQRQPVVKRRTLTHRKELHFDVHLGPVMEQLLQNLLGRVRLGRPVAEIDGTVCAVDVKALQFHHLLHRASHFLRLL